MGLVLPVDHPRRLFPLHHCLEAGDVTATLKLALDASGCDLAGWLEDHGIGHIRGAPYHPQTQGKIERWHQTLKNQILLENDYLPGDLENRIAEFVDHYNNHRYHESLNNVTPADAYFGRDTAIIERKAKIKNALSGNAACSINNTRLNINLR